MNLNLARELQDVPSYKPSWDIANFCDDPHTLCEANRGIMEWYGGNSYVRAEVFEFMRDQFKRFGLIPPDDDFLMWCWEFTFYYLDVVDPYALFFGVTDVIKTEENYYFQFSVMDRETDSWREVPSDIVEVFRYWEGGTKNWETLMRYPGLKEYFYELWDYFDDHFSYVAADSHPESFIKETRFIKRYGNKCTDLAHLGIWASTMWVCSPMAKEWRQTFHPIFTLVYESGACLISDWSFYENEMFKKSHRPANTCAKCMREEYCVELIQKDKGAFFLCEKCSHPKTIPGMVCGTRDCSKVSCEAHPGYKEARMALADRRYGDLKRLPNGQQIRALPGMIQINTLVLSKNANSITDVVNREFQRLLTL